VCPRARWTTASGSVRHSAVRDVYIVRVPGWLYYAHFRPRGDKKHLDRMMAVRLAQHGGGFSPSFAPDRVTDRQLGYVLGTNIVFESRSPGGKPELLAGAVA
jgi:hypothetical protein